MLDDCDDIQLRALLETDRKGAAWKVALARHLRESHLIPNGWLAASLHMGTPNSLSSQLSRHRKAIKQNYTPWKLLKDQENSDPIAFSIRVVGYEPRTKPLLGARFSCLCHRLHLDDIAK